MAKMYNEAFENIPKITIPAVRSNVRHVRHLYTILLDAKINRNKFFTEIRAKNIGVNLHYIPIYKFTYYQKNFRSEEEFPVTEEIFKRIITLPLFPKMTDEKIINVIEATKKRLRL